MSFASLRVAVNVICSEEHIFLEQQYGSRGRTPLPYHNAHHADDLTAYAIRVGKQLVHDRVMQPRDAELLRIAAMFHDHEQNLGPGANEKASAEAAEAAMRRYSHRFSDMDITRVKDAILSTQFDLINGVPHQRLVSNDPISRALADADLSAIGSDHWLDRTLRLFQEMEMKVGRWPEDGNPSQAALRDYLQTTADLMKEHKYQLKQSQQLQKALPGHRKELRRIIRDLESGKVDFKSLRSQRSQLSL